METGSDGYLWPQYVAVAAIACAADGGGSSCGAWWQVVVEVEVPKAYARRMVDAGARMQMADNCESSACGTCNA